MMKLKILILFFIAFQAEAQSNEKDILQLSRKKFDWMIHQQFDSLAQLLDERIQYIHSNGWIQTKKEVIDDIRSGKLIYEKIDITRESVRFYGQTAILTGGGKFQVKMNGSSLAFDLGYTEVYCYVNKKWLLVSRHGNRML